MERSSFLGHDDTSGCFSAFLQSWSTRRGTQWLEDNNFSPEPVHARPPFQFDEYMLHIVVRGRVVHIMGLLHLNYLPPKPAESNYASPCGLPGEELGSVRDESI